MQTKTEKWHVSSIFLEDHTAQTPNPIGRAMDMEAVEMFAALQSGALKNFVECGDSGVVAQQRAATSGDSRHKARREAGRS